MSRTQTVIQVTRAVQAVIDKSWIPEELSDWSFFSAYDLWHYMGVSDEKLCELCEVNDGMDMTGDVLRGKFPYLEIIDKNTIYPNTHPNCRCVLVRIAAPMEILSELGYGKGAY